MSGPENRRFLRRNRPGSRAENFCNWPDQPFEEMQTVFALQQYIQQEVRRNPANIDIILTPPPNQDEGAWKYEHMRQICLELNGLVVKLQDVCKPETCNKMTFTEKWVFLRAGQSSCKEWPPIIYMKRTLDAVA